MAAAWSPILDGEQRAHAWQVIEDIAAALREPPPPYDGKLPDEGLRAALTSREPGFALFYAYLERAQPGRGWTELARRHLDTALEHAPLILEKRPYFAFGFAGTAWAAEHLCGQLLEGEDVVDGIDEAVLAIVEQWDERQEFAYRKGLVGYALYALERLPRRAAAELLARIAERFEQSAVHSDDGVAWRSGTQAMMPHVQADFPDGLFDPGVLEGNAGVLGVLRAARANGIAKAGPLADGLAAWLWARRLPGESAFPAWIGGPLGPPCWYSGDAGIAAVWQASAALIGDPAELARARELALQLARAPIDDPRIVDASLAEGACGIAHCLHRLHARQPDPALADAARAWYQRALSMHRPGDGLGGFRFYSPAWQNDYIPEVPTGFIDAPGLLRGIAGVGLTLLAAVTDVEPSWDRAVLLSFRSPVTTP
jgi:lantibiotic biosynthesis protein